MKNKLRIEFRNLLWISFAVFAFTFCERTMDENASKSGSLEFSFAANELHNSLKSTSMDTFPVMSYHLLITIINSDSVVVEDRKMVPLYKFSDKFVSEKIELKNGFYFLSEFMVVGPMGDIIFAAPKYNAPLAHLVNRPLPIDFRISHTSTTNLNVEVLPVGDNPPEKFGYLSFGIDIIRPLKFYAAVYLDNPLIMAPSRLVAANVMVIDPKGKAQWFTFEPKVNEVYVRKYDGFYTFFIEALNDSLEYSYTLQQLLNSSQNNPLMIPIKTHQNQREFIFRTSPDSCKDALITDLNPNENFGKSKEFSASFISEPILTVMRTKKSLMQVDLFRHLPKSATVTKVELTLQMIGGVYIENMTANGVPDSSWVGGVFKPIIEPWDEHSVTWNKQPKTSSANNIYIDFEPWRSMNVRTYDVTRLFKPEQEIAQKTYGFTFELSSEDIPGGAMFASSDVEIPEMRPSFKVYYTLP